MAKVSVSCPKCQAHYSVEEAALGKKAKCKKPECGTTFVLTRSAERVRGDDGIPQTWEVGEVILEVYEVRKFNDRIDYAAGGMGRVNRVHHHGWNLDLAVKSVLPEKLTRPGAVEDFQREAEVWVDKLGLHPHVVTCQYVRVLGGLPRVFTEFVDGGSLKDWIDSGQLYEGGHEKALGRMLDILIQFAWGLHHAHEQGLIHQDVKPANVMMTASGVAKVTDFGLANARAELGEQGNPPAGHTLLATWGGMTPAYCSAEQAEIQAMQKARFPREQWPKLTRRTDIWSWAVSVLEMFTGEVVWPSGSVAGHYLKREARDGRIPKIPGAVAELLGRCLQRRPEDRHRTMLEVATALREVYRQVTGQPHEREQPEPAELLADSFNNRAVSLYDLGKKEEAKQKWREALQVDPHHPEATYNWGLVQWRSAQLMDLKLLQNLREVRASSADAAQGDYLLGLVHLERTDVQAAVHFLSQAVEASPGRADITAARAMAQALANPSDQPPPTFEGQTKEVVPVWWSPDGRYALSYEWEDKTLRLWEVSSGRYLRSFKGHTHMVIAVAWSPDGRHALSGSHDKTLRLWEAASGRCLRTLEGHTDRVISVSWSPDGRHALSGSREALRLWKVSSGQCLRTFKVTSWEPPVSWSPDGRFVLAGSEDGTLRLWEMASSRRLRTFEGHTGEVNSLSWSPDGRYALSGSDDKTLRLWEVASGRCLRTLEGHTGSPYSVAFSPDGRYALSGSGDVLGHDYTLRLWELSSGRCLRTLQGQTDLVSSVSWSPDGRYVFSASEETWRLWEVASGRCLRTLEGLPDWANSVSWSPDGRYALSGSRGFALRPEGIVFAGNPAPLITSLAVAASATLYRRLLRQAQEASADNPAVAAGLLEQARQQPGCSRREDALELARHLSHSLPHRSFGGGWEKRTCELPIEGEFSVSWSPDGRFALSDSSENYRRMLRLWEVASGTCLRTLEGHSSGLRLDSASWSPNSCLVLLRSDKTLRLWEVASGTCLRTFEGGTDWVNSVSWSPDGHHAVSGSSDYIVRLWDVSSGRCLRTFDGHTGPVNSVAWSPDGRYILSGSQDKTLRLWDVTGGKCLRSFRGHTEMVSSVAFSPDGRYLLSGSGSGDDVTLRLWDVSGGHCLRPLEGHSNYVTAVAWSPDGRHALSGSGDATVRLWEVSSGRCLRTLQGHDIGVTSVAWSPDGRTALSGGWDKALRLWEVASGQCVRTFQGHTSEVRSVSFSPDGRHALSGSADKALRLWQVASGACLRTLEGHTKDVTSVSWSPDGRHALSGSADGALRLWEAASGRCLRTLEGQDVNDDSLAWSPDGRYVLTGGLDKVLRLWEVATGRCAHTLEGHTGWVNAVAWGPDGRFALSADGDMLRLWEMATGKCLLTFEGHGSGVTSVSWSPDGHYALSGGQDKTLRLWEVASGTCLRTFKGHKSDVLSVSFSPDGRYALSGSGDVLGDDNTLRLWEVASGTCLRSFEGHTDWVTSVSWSPDGRFARSRSNDKTQRLWELDWELEPKQRADWDEGARPFLVVFLTLHTPCAEGLVRRGKPAWTEDDFRRLLDKLGCAGYGWLRPEGVRRELEKMASRWKGP